MGLFGSLARGDWDACSDVDLLALSQEGRQQLMQGLHSWASLSCISRRSRA